MKRVQDSVHGLMEFRGMEGVAIDLLRTPELQRLRRIRQLGLARLVFPAAEHSRFAHCLGAAHLAGRFTESLVVDSRNHLPSSLQPDEQIVRDLVLAALCHDLGHGPLSHTWEQHVIGELDDERRERWRESLGLNKIGSETSSGHQWHELVTQALLLVPGGDLHDLLDSIEKGTSERVAAILDNRFYLPYLTRLLHSDVDVDRCDFILRDAIQTGVAYGRYDLDWLVSTITVGVDPLTEKPVLGFDSRKAPRAVEQLLIARRALYDTVYHHRAIRSAEGTVGLLLKRAAALAKDDAVALGEIGGFDAIQRAIAGKALSIADLLELDDDSLWVFITRLHRHAEDPVVKELARRVLERDLLKAVPIGAGRLDELITARREEMDEKVQAVLHSAGYEKPELLYFVDRAKFSFFHSPPDQGSWFVNTSDPVRPAEPIINHPAFNLHRGESRVTHTLYVPVETVEGVREALEPQ